MVQANLFLGVAGLVIALVTGSIIASDWTDLANVNDYEATFQVRTERLAERGATVSPNAKSLQVYDVTHDNVTRMRIDLTWQDPALVSQPQVQLRVFDPTGRLRATETHRGGIAGIHLRLQLIADGEVPRASEAFTIRGGESEAQAYFDETWPPHSESTGNWTLEVESKPGDVGPSGSIFYNLRVEYDWYEGSWRRAQTGLVK